MENTTEHVSIHIPKYETESIQFHIPISNTSTDIVDIQKYISEKAEKTLEQCKYFEVSLPPSITGVTNESNRIEFKSFFQTPTLNDLEIVSTNPDGSSIKLNDKQLETVKQTGQFEVNSIHFPGQCHRWKLNRLLQSGIETANKTFFHELSWAVYMLLIFIRDRIQSDRFSFKSTLQSWKRGFLSLLDILIGLPATNTRSIDEQVEQERNKFLVNELLPHESENAMHQAFCEQVPILLQMMNEYNENKNRANQKQPPEMLPYPHHFIAPNNIAIDLRLYNDDLQRKIQDILHNLLSNSIPKNWFNLTKRRLINEYKHRQSELGLAKEEIAERVQTDINNEYTEQIFKIIENSTELENLSSGLGHLLVAQARSVLVMKSVVEKLNEQLEAHLKLTREKLYREHPIKSQIYRWIETKILNERIKYISEHEWDVHNLSIDQCRLLRNHQAAYFIQRDLIFRRDHEIILRQNLQPSIEPMKTINCNRTIWFPKNWIVERTYPLPIQQIPTYFAENQYTHDEEEIRKTLIHSNHNTHYTFRRHINYTVTTQYPFWRWKLFAYRIFCWLSNTIFTFCIAIPLASPISFQALFSVEPFTPHYYLDQEDLKLHKNLTSKTQTFISRLVGLWNNVRQSRRKFEQTPDRGFLGKNVQRIFNRLWNYVGKGLIGTIAVCTIHPVLCLILSTVSFILGILSPIWMPILTLIYHIGEILIYDADSAGKYTRKLFCIINIIVTDFLICGIIQPVSVLISLITTPIISLLITIYASLHRCIYGLYDTILYHIVIKRFARIPAHDGFLARRISGPGLASEYFYQVPSLEVLAALESLIEQKQLKAYGIYVERILRKPIIEYQQFFNQVFQPFSAQVQLGIHDSVYDKMNTVTNENIRQLQATIQKRNNLLRVQHGDKHNRIRLIEADLTAVLIKGTQLVEKWYPNQILPYFPENDIEKFWNDHDLEENDWFGLTSKLLQELFCRDILTPLEQTDAFYSLKIDHLTLTKYAQMINSADIHDDLDVVTSVYMPETSYTIQQPSFDQQIFNPIEYNRNNPINFEYHRFDRLSKTKLRRNYHLSRSYYMPISVRLLEVMCVNIIIYNHNNNNSTTNILKNTSFQEIVKLIEYNRRFYKESILPLSLVCPNTTTNDNVLIIDETSNDDNHIHN